MRAEQNVIVRRKFLGRYQTLCIDCGCVLSGIDSAEPQHCYCGKIYAQNGRVHEVEKS